MISLDFLLLFHNDQKWVDKFLGFPFKIHVSITKEANASYPSCGAASDFHIE